MNTAVRLGLPSVTIEVPRSIPRVRIKQEEECGWVPNRRIPLKKGTLTLSISEINPIPTRTVPTRTAEMKDYIREVWGIVERIENAAGIIHALELLKHPDLIPKEWESILQIFFPATYYSWPPSYRNERLVPYICHTYNDGWIYMFTNFYFFDGRLDKIAVFD